MKKINLIVSIILVFSVQSAFADITLTVTNHTQLFDAMEDAIEHANIGAGQTSTIILNAGGLITMSSALPEINHIRGKVIIKKGDLDPDNEGLIAGAYLNGFMASSSDLDRGDVEIDGLIFEGFEVAISFQNFDNVKITNCDFTDCSQYAIYMFYYPGGSLWSAQILDGDVIVSNNTFEDCNIAVDLILNEFILSEETAEEDYTNDAIYVENNTITDCKRGLNLRNDSRRVFANYFIRNNTLTNSTNITASIGVLIRNPRRGYVVMENTDVTRFETGLYFGGDAGTLETHHTFGIDFIEEPNTADLTEINLGNDIVDCMFSYNLGGEFNEYNLVRLDVEGKIAVARGFPTAIRECVISKPVSWSYGPGTGYHSDFIPIDHRNFPTVDAYPKLPNDGIGSPTLINVEILATDIFIDYMVFGLDVENLNYVIEFFEIDDDKSIVQFIGNQLITSAIDAYGLVEFNDVSITGGNKIGATITSLGNVLDGERIGTSELTPPMVIHDQLPCEDCEKFSPTPGGHYWVSAWVNVGVLDEFGEEIQVKNYDNVSVQLLALGDDPLVELGIPTGDIIDGWQRIIVDFTMPETSEYFKLRLNAHPDFDTYFDDIRIHPFNGSMKSYVYDGETFWLTSELDDNNYATFYEYDQEGGLIRIKKETSRGIVTIQETRSNTIKKDDE